MPADLSTLVPDLSKGGPGVIVVMQSMLHGWTPIVTNTAAGSFSVGPATAPLALGGFRLQSGTGDGPDQGGKSWLLTSVLSGTRLADIDAMNYRTYVRASSKAAPQLAPSMNLQIDVDGDGTRDTALVFEPVYVPDQGTVTHEQWQTWDAWRGKWWVTVATSAFCAAACTFTVPQFLVAHPKAAIVEWGEMPGTALLVGQRSGGSWANFDGDVDGFVFSKKGVPTTYDFEPEASACRDGGFAASKNPVFATQQECVAYHQ